MSCNECTININIPTEYNVNFSSSGSIDLNISPIETNISVEEIIGKITQTINGSIDANLNGCIGVKKCDKNTCTTIIDTNTIYIEIINDTELLTINKTNERISLEVVLKGTKANGNIDFQTMTINLQGSENVTTNIDNSIIDICIVDYIENNFISTLIPK